jgi:hypothetical protein
MTKKIGLKVIHFVVCRPSSCMKGKKGKSSDMKPSIKEKKIPINHV